VLAIETDLKDQHVTVLAIDVGAETHWSVLPISGLAPLEHYLVGVVHDPVRDRLLMIGSRWGGAVETWAASLSGTPTWQHLATSNEPTSRWGQSTIYDAIHDRVVMFGGADWHSYPTVYMSETWSLDLLTGAWTQVQTTGSLPQGREGHGAIYDPARQRMLLFGGHYEAATRGFLNDLWELSLGDTAIWSEIVVSEPRPGPRSAFGIVYDPLRRWMLVHGGLNDQSGVEPDNLWALKLDGTPGWTPISTVDTLRGRSYPVDVYDPIGDRLLACGGAGYPQVSSLSLAAPNRWDALLPVCCPLTSPSSRFGHGVVYDSRRDRFLVVGGDYSSADSALWSFRTGPGIHWVGMRGPSAPYAGFEADHAQTTEYDSLSDRVILFDGAQAWALSAANPVAWVPLGPMFPRASELPPIGSAAGVAIDDRRHRLLVSGGYQPYAHSSGYSVGDVWALSLGSDPTWYRLGDLPTDSYGHVAFYDAIRDRMVIVGGTQVHDVARSRRSLGAVVWSSPVDSVLRWTLLSALGDAALPGPPKARATYDPRTGRMFLACDSSLWVRQIDNPAPWMALVTYPTVPTITNAIAYDPARDQLLALFASPAGSTTVDAWALAVGPLSVKVLASERASDAVTIRLRSTTAWGHSAVLERSEEITDWQVIGPLAFGIEGETLFTDHSIRPGHDYHYRVGILNDTTMWYSDDIFVPDPGSLRLAVLGSRPNPAVGRLRLAFSLPALGPARIEVFDLNGRRCLAREVGPMGPGTHAIDIAESVGWRAGVYYARLQRNGESRKARMVLLP